MLVLTQLSVGAFVIDLLLRLVAGGHHAQSVGSFDSLLALAVGTLALGASVLHLGRPQYAYRAVIGLRHSWLSREVVAFGTFTAFTATYAMLVSWGPWPRNSMPVTVLGGLVAAAGIAGVACSVKVYVVTRRAAWRATISGPKFALTTAVCGLATVYWASLFSSAVAGHAVAGNPFATIGVLIPLVLVALVVVELAWEAAVVQQLLGIGRSRVAGGQGLDPDLNVTVAARLGAAVIGGIALPLVLAAAIDPGSPSWLAFGLGSLMLVGIVAGELLERVMFFAVSIPPR
jgi:DMSO reductase anchor subunit